MAVEGMTGSSSSDGIAFLVSAGVMYEIIAAACSSPQTTEINASTRAGTLKKWVKLGLLQGVFFVGAAALFDPRHRTAIAAGGGLAAALLWWQYEHAAAEGLRNPGPPTETWGPRQ